MSGAIDGGGSRVGTTTMREAINQALADALETDPKVLLFGEDIGALGGIFRVTDGLQARFGSERVFDTPSAEAGIAGVALGLALAGFRPIAEFQFDGFAWPGLDQVVSHLAKYRMRTKGRVGLPVTIRIPVGAGLQGKEHHAESPETAFASVPGLKVVTPSNPADAHRLLTQAIADPDPVIFLEPKRLYRSEGSAQPASDLDMTSAFITREGSDLTLLAYGGMLPRALEAAARAEHELDASIQVVDLRCLAPLDVATITGAVRTTGRAVVVHEAPRTLGLGAELAARITEDCFEQLQAPVARVTGYDTPYPPPLLQDAAWIPTVDRILDAVARTLERRR